VKPVPSILQYLQSAVEDLRLISLPDVIDIAILAYVVYKIIGLVLAGLALALGIFLGVKALIPAKEPVFDPGTGTGAGIGTETGTGDSGNTGTAPSNDRTKQIDIDDLLKQIPENDVNDKPKPRPGPRPGPEPNPNPNPNPNPPVPTPDPAPKNVEQTVDPTFM
jgi:outer membrane biosynthesis protein TonB